MRYATPRQLRVPASGHCRSDLLALEEEVPESEGDGNDKQRQIEERECPTEARRGLSGAGQADPTGRKSLTSTRRQEVARWIHPTSEPLSHRMAFGSSRH